MVRTKFTPPRYKLVLPDVTEEMIRNFRRVGRPKSDKNLEYQLIRSEIVERLLEEQNAAFERRVEARRKAREEQERQVELEEQRLEMDRLEREQLEREQKDRDRMERECLENERARVEREKLAQEWAEQERLARRQIERERAEEARMEREQAEGKRMEEERIAQAILDVEREAQARFVRYRQEREPIEQERLARKRAKIELYGEEEYYKRVRKTLELSKLRRLQDELFYERRRTRTLFNKPDPMFESRSLALEQQLNDHQMVLEFELQNQCPRIRERNRGSAIEMQRMIELYDMIAEDWELDDMANGEGAECRVTTTTPPCDSNEPSSLSALVPQRQPKHWQYYLDDVNNMENPDFNTLLERFGSKPYYRWMFTGRQTHDAIKTYEQLDRAKRRNETEYEVARQKYLQILGFHANYWHATNPTRDRSVEISKLYRDISREYLSFMRIRCGGYRAETYTTSKMRIVFHLLLGRVSFSLNKRSRIMTRGSHITVNPRSTYAINCLGRDQAAYFVFHISYTDHSGSPTQFSQYFGLSEDP